MKKHQVISFAFTGIILGLLTKLPRDSNPPRTFLGLEPKGWLIAALAIYTIAKVGNK
jgi:hypothetical protein